jgi:hypothetical protein
MREIIRRVVDVRQTDDPYLHYLDGLSLFGEADVDDLPDALHPSGEGYLRIGQRFSALVFEQGGLLAEVSRS